jgi:lipoprotein-releasing system permease protein
VPDYFMLTVALRHLRYGWGQSLLSLGLVTISVVVLILLAAVLGGVREKQVNAVTGAQPQIILERAERKPVAAWELPAGPDAPLYVGQTVDLPRSQNKIEDWRGWIDFLDRFDPRVVVASPAAAGQVFMSRGARRESQRVIGVDPARQNLITDFEGSLVAGRFLQLNAGEIAIGKELATEYGLRLGDKVKLLSAEEIAGSYAVAAIYETGFGALDKGSIMMQLRDAQALLGLGSAVSYIGLKLSDPFAADEIATRLAPQVPFKTRSWLQDNQAIFDQLRNMASVTSIVRSMVTIAVGFAIASILITVVTSKYREIGILKAMGAQPGQIRGLFLLEGFLLALIGSLIGLVLGTVLLDGLGSLMQVGPGGRLVPRFAIDRSAEVRITTVIIAVLVGAVAAWIPARRAAAVDPMQVIRSA